MILWRVPVSIVLDCVSKREKLESQGHNNIRYRMRSCMMGNRQFADDAEEICAVLTCDQVFQNMK